jgi:hypothetical protein
MDIRIWSHSRRVCVSSDFPRYNDISLLLHTLIDDEFIRILNELQLGR